MNYPASPNEKREAKSCNPMAVDIKGNRVAIEALQQLGIATQKNHRYVSHASINLIRIRLQLSKFVPYHSLSATNTRKNYVPGGTVYMLPIVKPGKLVFQLIAAIPHQARAFDADMRLALNTADGSSKKDLLLELESMPVPVKFLPGHYSDDGVIIEDPMTWANIT
jgi:hypothetical protein